MGKALHKLGLWMDDFTIKKKFYIFYVVCVLIPLIVTDSVVFLTTAKFDRERREHEMSNIASAVEYSLSSMIGNAGEIGNSIYTNRDFEEFLSKRYTNSAECGGISEFPERDVIGKCTGNEQYDIYPVYG